jgi:hypothetical protein
VGKRIPSQHEFQTCFIVFLLEFPVSLVKDLVVKTYTFVKCRMQTFPPYLGSKDLLYFMYRRRSCYVGPPDLRSSRPSKYTGKFLPGFYPWEGLFLQNSLNFVAYALRLLLSILGEEALGTGPSAILATGRK